MKNKSKKLVLALCLSSIFSSVLRLNIFYILTRFVLDLTTVYSEGITDISLSVNVINIF
jgi:hypothetical protein